MVLKDTKTGQKIESVSDPQKLSGLMEQLSEPTQYLTIRAGELRLWGQRRQG
jgi:hypothetical protein